MSPISEDAISQVIRNRSVIDRQPSARNPEKSAYASDSIPPAYDYSSSTLTSNVSFASVSLHMTDRIRFLHFPDSDLPQLVNVISEAWSIGVQNTRQYAGSFEVQLKGNPWVHTSSSVVPGPNHARRLIRILLEALYNMGWAFDTAIRACRKTHEKDTLIFVKHNNDHPLPPLRDWFIISAEANSSLNIQRGPPEFARMLCQRLGKQVAQTSEDDSNFVISLKGVPWVAIGKQTMKVREMLLMIRETLDVFGCKIYASLRMMNGSYEGDVLVCCRSESGDFQGSFL